MMRFACLRFVCICTVFLRRVCAREHAHVRVCACARVRVCACARVSVCAQCVLFVFACVCDREGSSERERESKREIVCVRERESKRERKRERSSERKRERKREIVCVRVRARARARAQERARIEGGQKRCSPDAL